MSFTKIYNTYSQKLFKIMEIDEIIELLNVAIEETDWGLVSDCIKKMENACELNDGSLDNYFTDQEEY